ncbi:MAG: DNA translocase FtsK [Atopobiaceae bacterium]|nr:DNA translocase FtsK [Atopobiaceae bacterium]MCH4180899.1 DNA translocase FtsK [Atopobiaceae bacterium]MCH4213982.1 DNA translocase FtsK [Atopobiaceae bacterium]MCH4230632.1 DNA translocase FtsK [Atopobiaceae bacterium]MCH4275555.1 DNA translocase FtsK [Atopobiaceae bacterium]
MPKSRTQNAAKKKNGARQSRTASKPKSDDRVVGGTARNDIAGVTCAVLSVAMVLSLVSPSSALVTHACSVGLTMGFGSGALLVPIALFLFSLTFFVRSEKPISARAAVGLSMVVLAVLALLSLNVPGVELMPDSLFQESVLAASGGYVGAGIAWVLVRLVGTVVGDVILAGLIIAGVIVCGFSISDLVLKVRRSLNSHRAQQVRDAEDGSDTMRDRRRFPSLRSRSRVRPTDGIDEVEQVPPVANPAQASLLDGDGNAVTTYIGARQTSVLKRGASRKPGKSGRARKAATEAPKPVPAVVQEVAVPEDDGQDATRGSVPEFLESGAKRTTKRAHPRGKRGEKDIKAGSPKDLKRPGDASSDLELPPLSILDSNPNSATSASSQSELQAVANRLQGTLEEFGLASKVVGWVAGPRVTTFKISMGEGERVSKITNLEDDIALSLASKSVRIFAPIPGTSLVGIEIPNKESQSVCLGDVLPYAQGGPLDVAFGRDSEGKPIVVDLATLPHLLVAGTTGSGKSVMLNSIIMSILMRATPDQVRLIMVDPKRVEFTGYAGLPHLYVPVVTEPRQAASALQWGVSEMERRLKVFEHYRVRDIKTYNRNVSGGKWDSMDNPPKAMPYFVIVIDELADLMMVAGKDVEASIVRIAQLGRAAGIHLVVATQRPSADVVTGLIKANIDNRVALSVDNGMNSRIILDQTGAERLLGNGDMLVKLRGKRPRRAQGCFVSDSEIEQTVEFIKQQVTPEYHDEILSAVVPGRADTSDEVASDDDPLVWEAAQIVVDSQLGSTSGLQRRLKVGYARAGRIMDMLEQKGVVGPPDGSKPREVLLDAAGLEELRSAETEFREV